MMRLIVCAVLALVLTACGGIPPAIQRVEVPVPVSCIKTVPAKPMLPAVPKAGIFDQAKALIVRDKMRAGYESELEALLEACK